MRKVNSKFIYVLITIIFFLTLSFLYFSKNNDILTGEIISTTHSNNKNKDNSLKYTKSEINKLLIKSNLDELILKEFKKPLDLQNFSDIRNKVELHTYLFRSIFGEYEDNPKEYLKKITENSKFLNEKNTKTLKWDEKLLATLHQSLYPWLYGYRFQNFEDIIEYANGRGIVMCVGDRQFKYALSTVDSLRNIIKCDLPIEIFYNGPDDLSKENRNKLLSYDDVYVSDLTTYFDNEIVNNSGWDSKPFSILASRFDEVMLMDADVTYLRNPAELYEEENYQKVGTLYFMDRSLFPEPYEGTEWLSQWMVNPLPETANLRFLNGTSTYEMESSTVLMHKSKTILGLLATCKLNEKKMRDDVVYKMVYGDKETFWLGFDMARQHYYLDPTPCVFIGKVDEQNQICGHLGHVLHDKLYYWNGHIVVNKDAEKLEYVDYDSYSYDYIGSEWSSDLDCIVINEDKNPAHKMTDEEMRAYKRILAREKLKHFIIPEGEEN